jgi:hypothetical protein
MQQAASALQFSDAVVRRLVAQKTLPAKQIVKFAPWMIEREIWIFRPSTEPFVSSIPVDAIHPVCLTMRRPAYFPIQKSNWARFDDPLLLRSVSHRTLGAKNHIEYWQHRE